LWKEAFFYEREGYEVVVLTMWQSGDLLERDRALLEGHRINYKPYLNLIPGQISATARFYYRLRKRLACELQKWFRIGTGWAISHAPERMLAYALDEKADLYAAHLECAFFVGRDLIKAGKKVSFDFEDWYSRDYLTAERAVKLLMKTERYALERGVFCTAASKAMAASLKREYTIAKDISVVYNSFPDESVHPSYMDAAVAASLTDKIQMVWTSRTVGPDRGLETLVQAFAFIDSPVVLTLIGKTVPGYQQSIQALLPTEKGHQLNFIDFISHKELMHVLPTFDFGLALEKKYPANKNTTISNKILQYLQVNIAVFATDTAGQKEVATYFPDSVFLLKAEDPKLWADTILTAIVQKKTIDKARQQKIYQEHFSWSKQEQKLKQLISEHL
jgi:hypothetical protein